MTESVWLTRRVPSPPADLAAGLEQAVVDVHVDETPLVALSDAAEEVLLRALGQPGRVRGAAFDLLIADALVTYACEAAMESDNPDAALDRLVTGDRS